MARRDVEHTHLMDVAAAWASGDPDVVQPPAALDAERFSRLASSQTALQTLAPRIHPRALPDASREQTLRGVELARRRSVMLLLELERILPGLAEAGLRPVVLKGASLALMVYDRPDARWFVDLDVLIEPEHLDRAYDVLQGMGYRFNESAAAGELYDRYHFHRILLNDQGVCVEIHWALTLPASVYTYDLDAVRRDAVEIPLGEAAFLAPSVVDQILHGVLQSIADGYSDLRRLLDLHLLDARLSEPEREVLCARANANNLSTGLWLQYYLRQRILGAAIPEFMAVFCAPDAGLARVFERLGVVESCLDQRALRQPGYASLLHWLCTPAHLRRQEVRRYVLPSVDGLVNAGLCRNGPVPLWKRGQLAVSRSLVAGRLLGEWLRATV